MGDVIDTNFLISQEMERLKRLLGGRLMGRGTPGQRDIRTGRAWDRPSLLAGRASAVPPAVQPSTAFQLPQPTAGRPAARPFPGYRRFSGVQPRSAPRTVGG
jgi:hypothetical protein